MGGLKENIFARDLLFLSKELVFLFVFVSSFLTKKETQLNAFKKIIIKWQHENCPCRLCKSYIQNLGFI